MCVQEQWGFPMYLGGTSSWAGNPLEGVQSRGTPTKGYSPKVGMGPGVWAQVLGVVIMELRTQTWETSPSLGHTKQRGLGVCMVVDTQVILWSWISRVSDYPSRGGYWGEAKEDSAQVELRPSEGLRIQDMEIGSLGR